MQDGIDMNNLLSSPQSSLQDLHPSHFDPISADHDFLDQMFSSIPPTSCSWPELNPSDLSPTNEVPGDSNGGATFNHFGESALLASKLRQHQTGAGSSGAAKAMMLQQQMLMMARGFDRPHGDVQGGDDSMYNGFGGSLHGGGPHFPHPQGGSQSFAAEAPVTKPAPVASGSTAASGDGGTGKPKQRVRARRGQATDPHSIAERLRRERIAERMKALQELVPNANKTDKASMLDEIIDYVKFIQLQVKVLSMSRLGSARAAAVAPMVALADHQDGRGGDCTKGSGGSSGDSMAVTENQVAKLLEEDMGSAMQYLQGKGLCLMPISLATAISSATCRNPTTIPGHGNGNGDGPTSPNMSALTVQSSAAAANGGGSDGSSTKDTEP